MSTLLIKLFFNQLLKNKVHKITNLIDCKTSTILMPNPRQLNWALNCTFWV